MITTVLTMLQSFFGLLATLSKPLSDYFESGLPGVEQEEFERRMMRCKSKILKAFKPPVKPAQRDIADKVSMDFKEQTPGMQTKLVQYLCDELGIVTSIS